jgi:pantoate--beta-alanine ligase
VIDYIAICDPETLADIEIIDRSALMALAVNVGKTRLIDNMILNPE